MSNSNSDEAKHLSAEVNLSWFKSALKELRNLCGSESLSEEGLRNFFEKYKLLTSIDNDDVITNNNISRGYGFFFKACMNENVDEGIIQYLLKYFPGAANNLSEKGHTPLQHACNNKNVTLNIVDLLLDAAPESVRHTTNQSEKTSLHLLCGNEGVGKATAVEILKLLLSKYPEAAGLTDARRRTPLHYACHNKNIAFSFVELLLKAAPRSICHTTSASETPLHLICINKGVDKATAVEILKLLLSTYPEAAEMASASDRGYTPLHCACHNKNVSLELVDMLLKAAPKSVRLTTTQTKATPLHVLCTNKDIDEVTAVEILKMLLEKYPKAAYQRCGNGVLPLHIACAERSAAFCRALVDVYPNAVKEGHPINLVHLVLRGPFQSNNGRDAVDIVKYLLDCDPSVKLQRIRGHSLLRWACKRGYDDSNVEAGVQIINAIYDAHPDAIYDFTNTDVLVLNRMRDEVRTFVQRELIFAREAKDVLCLQTPDENGKLPLHRAVGNNVTLGSIKLLVKGCPLALAYTDNEGALPLHVACQHHNSPYVVQYLIRLEPASLRDPDHGGNTALHWACRGANYATIAMLLEEHDAVSLSKRNSDKKLPIDLLFESSEVDDKENAEYVGIVFRLLQSYPETLHCFKNHEEER